MNPGDHLLNIAEAGLAFSDLPPEKLNLGVLLDIENILDKGRLYANPNELSVINEKMDELRGRIRVLLDAMPDDESIQFMITRGRQAQNQFSLKALYPEK